MTTKLVPRARKERKSVSVIVPCSHKHVRLLPALIEHLGAQTRKADEIVVAVSGCAAAPAALAGVRILHSSAPQTCGHNRNHASEVAVGDVLIYQDADDLPHPQRVEIIAGLFETYEIEHLMHHYFYKTSEPRTFTLEEAVVCSAYYAEPKLGSSPKVGADSGVTNGNVAIARTVFQAVRWPSSFGIGTDQTFNRAVYARFTRTAVTQLPLLTYRHDLSSFR